MNVTVRALLGDLVELNNQKVELDEIQGTIEDIVKGMKASTICSPHTTTRLPKMSPLSRWPRGLTRNPSSSKAAHCACARTKHLCRLHLGSHLRGRRPDVRRNG